METITYIWLKTKIYYKKVTVIKTLHSYEPLVLLMGVPSDIPSKS